MKRLLISSSIVSIIGLFLIFISFVMTGFNSDEYFNAGRYEYKTIEFNNNTFIFENCDKVKVSTFIGDQTPFIILYENNNVSFDIENNIITQFGITESYPLFKDQYLEVFLPQNDEMYNFEFNGTNSSIIFDSIPNIGTLESNVEDASISLIDCISSNVNLLSTNSSLFLNNSIVRGVIINSNKTEIYLNESIMSNITIDASKLHFQSTNNIIDFDINFECAIISVVLIDTIVNKDIVINASYLSLKASNSIINKLDIIADDALIELNSIISDNTININCFDVTLRVDLSNLDKLNVKSDVGYIYTSNTTINRREYNVDKGSIKGNLPFGKESYTFSITTNGTSNVETGGNGEYYIKIKSSNVDVLYSF